VPAESKDVSPIRLLGTRPATGADSSGVPSLPALRIFQIYLDALTELVTWFHAMDHNNYAHWISVHLRDMVTLPTAHPDRAGLTIVQVVPWEDALINCQICITLF